MDLKPQAHNLTKQVLQIPALKYLTIDTASTDTVAVLMMTMNSMNKKNIKAIIYKIKFKQRTMSMKSFLKIRVMKGSKSALTISHQSLESISNSDSLSSKILILLI